MKKNKKNLPSFHLERSHVLHVISKFWHPSHEYLNMLIKTVAEYDEKNWKYLLTDTEH